MENITSLRVADQLLINMQRRKKEDATFSYASQCPHNPFAVLRTKDYFIEVTFNLTWYEEY